MRGAIIDKREQVTEILGKTQGFLELGVPEAVVKSLYRASFINPTPIEEQAIPYAIKGVDIVAKAKNGTGKTGAFTIPIISQIKSQNAFIQAVILTHTRELAIQISEVIEQLGEGLSGIDNRVLCLIGGNPLHEDLIRIKKFKPSIVISTPIKLRYMLEDNNIELDHVSMIAIDEADFVLSKEGFKESVAIILEALPNNREIELFSATFSSKIEQFIENYMTSPEFVNCIKDVAVPQGLTQYMGRVSHEDNKPKVIACIFSKLQFCEAIVFVSTPERAEALHDFIAHTLNIPCNFVHGEFEQEERNRIFYDFKHNNARILVATALYARGVDVREVNVVVNYDLPRGTEEYLHRIGRGGRFGHKSIAISLYCSDAEKHILEAISEDIGGLVMPLPKRVEDIPVNQYVINQGDIEMG